MLITKDAPSRFSYIYKDGVFCGIQELHDGASPPVPHNPPIDHIGAAAIAAIWPAVVACFAELGEGVISIDWEDHNFTYDDPEKEGATVSACVPCKIVNKCDGTHETTVYQADKITEIGVGAAIPDAMAAAFPGYAPAVAKTGQGATYLQPVC